MLSNNSTVSFPAFQRQSQSVQSSSSIPNVTQPTISLSNTTLAQPTIMNDNTKPKMTISKKVNARLQLAAALIECDNDRILSRAIPATPVRHSPNSPRPPPPPQPKLASESAIFSPYRDDQPAIPATIHRRPSGISNVGRLSNGDLEAGDGSRPSIDFLGVKLPKERKYAYSTHSRGGSSIGGFEGATSMGGGGGHSRTASLLSSTGLPQSNISLADGNQDEDDDQALSDWGVEKFLSAEQRDKIASGRRSRANSIAGVVSTNRPTSPGGSRKPWEGENGRPGSTMSVRSANDPIPLDPGAGVGAGRARSEIVESATSGPSKGGADLSLLARIKLYRERQENLPPDQWNGPGPNATSGEVVEHIFRNSPRNARIELPTLENFDQPIPSNTIALESEGTSTSASIDPISAADLSTDSSNTKSAVGSQPPLNQTAQIHHSEEFRRLHTRELSTSRVPAQGGADLERRMSALGVTGDRWSDQEDDEDDEETEELGDFRSSTAVKASKGEGRISTRSSRASSPRPNPRHSRGGSLPLDLAADSSILEQAGSVSPPPAQSAGASPILGGNKPLGFISPRPLATPLQEFEPPPEGMVGIGSYQRSRSRRNSVMALAAEPVHQPTQDSLVNPWGEENGAHSEEGPGSRPGSRPLSPINASRTALQTSRPTTPSGLGGRQTPILGVGAILQQDPFNAHNIGPSPFPSPMMRLSELAAEEIRGAGQALPAPRIPGLQGSQRMSLPMDGLTTKQLQALARGSTFPEHFGIGSGIDDSPSHTEDESKPLTSEDLFDLARAEKKRKKKEKEKEKLSKLPPLVNLGDDSPIIATAQAVGNEAGEVVSSKKKEKQRKTGRNSMLLALALANGPTAGPDLSSSRWSRGKKTFDRENVAPPFELDFPPTDYSTPASTPRQVLAPVKLLREPDDVDDSATSPPVKGPLKPRGIEIYLPSTLIMPQPLQGSPQAPCLRLTKSERDRQQSGAGSRNSLYVPEGFVLHDGKGLPPVKQLQVHGASGPRPYFNPLTKVDGKQKHDAAVSEFLQSKHALRYLAIPASAPRGIGRRAAAPTTALFRNQLVKHEEEREGWGWEMGSAIGDQISTPQTEDSEEPLSNKITRAQKKREKKLAREKRKRKAARRERRAKRDQAVREGKGYAALGVQEDSPDEDLDLSSTSSEEEESDTASEDEWNSEDEKRWIDHSKPAGKLFGKSLLDVAAERQTERKSKARAYGQYEIEDEERADEAYAAKAASLGLPLDAASMAPSSAARSFRDKPLGYNDTRERMEATFGTDLNWAREMAKRREIEAKEAEEAEIRKIAEEEFRKGEEERAARKKAKGIFRGKKQKEKAKKPISAGQISAPIPQESFSGYADSVELPTAIAEEHQDENLPPRSLTPAHPPTINLDFGGELEQHKQSQRKGASEAAAEWFAKSSDEESSNDSSSEDEAERRKLAMQKARLSRSLGGTGKAKLLAAHLAEDEDDSSSEDGVPLAQIKQGLASKSPSFASALNLGGQAADESSDEELPLAALKAKRKAANGVMGSLNLDFGGAGSPKALSNSRSLASLLRSTASPAVAQNRGEDSDSDEDRPLGLVHVNGENALAQFRASNPIKADDSSSDEDDRPLGTQHRETARRVIKEQANLIAELRLQAEAAQYRNSGMPMMSGFDPRMSMMGGMGMPGMPLPVFQSGGGFDSRMSSMNLAAMSTPQLNSSSMIASQEVFPTSIAQHSGLPPINISAPSPVPMSHPIGMIQDPKVSSIDRWRSEVPADGSSSAENSKPASEIRS